MSKPQTNKPLKADDLMPFGKYAGTPMAEVPRSYLDWLWSNGLNRQETPVAKYIRQLHNDDALDMVGLGRVVAATSNMSVEGDDWVATPRNPKTESQLIAPVLDTHTSLCLQARDFAVRWFPEMLILSMFGVGSLALAFGNILGKLSVYAW
jgi:uncharacterized protein (DUF3820 family)